MAMTSTLPTNISPSERILTALAGAGLFALAVRFPRARKPLGAASMALLLRSATGYCPAYDAAGVPDRDADRRSDTRWALGGSKGESVDVDTVIARPPHDVYAFWRDVTQLARALPDTIQVEALSATESQWTLKRGAMPSARWTARLINDEPGRLIAWKTIDHADVVSAGSVHFTSAADGQATNVHVRFQYAPPMGRVGARLASMVGQDGRSVVQRALDGIRRHLEGAGDRSETQARSADARGPVDNASSIDATAEAPSRLASTSAL